MNTYHTCGIANRVRCEGCDLLEKKYNEKCQAVEDLVGEKIRLGKDCDHLLAGFDAAMHKIAELTQENETLKEKLIQSGLK